MRITLIHYEDLALGDDQFTNPRRSVTDEAQIRELADDIARNGLLYPLLVWRRPNRWVVVGGQRRYLALGMLIERKDPTGMRYASEGVPCHVVHDSEDPDAALVAALADQIHRQDLSSYDVAQALEDLRERLGSNKAVADEIHKSTSWVSRHLKAWRKAGDELKAAWADGLAFETVLALCELEPADQARKLAEGDVNDHVQAKRRTRRGGSHGRPGIERVKELIAAADPQNEYQHGVVAALRFVAGEADESELRLGGGT